MDPAGGLLPSDERGEIVLRGPAITAGYDNDAAATAGAFHNGWFRTGDLGYLDQDGYLFILGRLKDVIDRGSQKVAPAEIEDALCKHPDIVEAVAFAVPHERLGEDVAAAVVLRSGAQVTERMLQQHVREQLASYKVPRLISIVPHIPRTSGGKIQRSSLAVALSIMPETLREPAAGSDNATTATERTLLEIWADVFATDRIGLLDDFFSLGGDSLLAVQVIIRVEHAFGIKFPVRELFEMHHLRALALWIDEAKHTPATDRVTDAIPLRSAGALSFVQENMLRSEWAVPGLPQNTLPFAFRLDGPLDVHALRQSVDELVRRHEVLRTGFGQVDGEPTVVIMPADALRAVLIVEDISAGFPAVSDASRALFQQKAALILQQESWSTIDVTRPPLFRLRLLRLAENDHVLILVLHHIICDWWSIGVFKDELSELYAALTGGRPPRLGPPGAGFSGFAAWQRDWATTEAATRQCDWWTQTLRDASPLFPHHGLHRSDLLSASVSGGCIDFPNDLVARLRAFSRSQGVTPFVTLLTAFKLMLLAKTGRDDICVGTPVANRSRLWTERLVGPVQNATIIRTRIGADLPFEEALQRVGSSVLDALTRQELPFDVLAERLAGNFGADTASLLQVVFSMRNSVHRPLRFPAVSVASFGDQYREGQPAVPLDLSWLTLTLTPVPSGISGYWRYKPDLPGTEILRDFSDQFPMVLEILINNPRLSLSALT
jgi:acyl carrier protein